MLSILIEAGSVLIYEVNTIIKGSVAPSTAEAISKHWKFKQNRFEGFFEQLLNSV